MRVRVSLIALAASIVLSMTVLAQRTPVKPDGGSRPADDIKLGQDAAREIEKELVLITNRDANTYITTLGQRLLSKAPNPSKFPFTFKVVDDKSINAFALPGGPIYMHRGAIEAADNEAQIAGVMGHEIAHVLLRHGAAQQRRGGLLGGIAGIVGAAAGDSTIGQVVGMGAGAFASLKLLKYSREAETNADLMGTQMLYDSGYDPKAMAEFFEKLARENKGSKVGEFLSNHPNPGNRVANVNEEIRKIGPPLANPKYDSADFQRVKKALLAMPAPKAPPTANGQPSQPAATSAPPAPSTRMVDLRIGDIALRHPDNWKPSVNGDSITLAPAGGLNQKGDLAYGMIIDVFTPQNARNLDQATDQFLAGLQRSNPAMKVVRSRVATRVDSWPAQRTELSNDSPAGGKETDIVITLLRSNNEMQYFVLVAPTKDMPQYERTFQSILSSVQLR
jgi:Zn-dependent protease with chaperone function